MIQLIVGAKGKGKTKHILDKVNGAVKTVDGNIVYLDKNAKHMYELKNKIRLINTSEFPFTSTDEFLGFVCGVVSQDHDLQEVYFDSFLNIAFIDDISKINEVLAKLDKMSDQFHVDFIISMSVELDDLAEEFKSKVIVSL